MKRESKRSAGGDDTRSKGDREKLKRNRIVYFATGNSEKLAEVDSLLDGYALTVEQVNAKGLEIQSDSVEEIAENSAFNAASKTGLPILVEDTGLFIHVLKGFPGPYASYVYRTIGPKGVLALMKRTTVREAYFLSAVSFALPGRQATTFTGKAQGRIAASARGSGGFGYDSVFEPEGGSGRTFAEMSLHDKNLLSHRAQAVKKFAEWFLIQGRGG